VKIDGPIGSRGQASAENVVKALRSAFDNPRAKAVLLAIDSPGGSPVQAELISAEVKRLRGLYPDRPVIAVIADTGASAAYYIAAAAERIYASRASLVGSIGVRIDSFGFDGALRELGVERRLLTAGSNKGILDPFSPLPGEQRVFVQGVLDELHQQFITAVRDGRGERLQGGEELFTGLFWSGEAARNLGLVDALGGTRTVLDNLSLEHAVDYTPSAFAQALRETFGAVVDDAVGSLTGREWTWR
jgi:protease-4